ncbi:MAG TPA: sulfur oxidation c-type cytochrome SoxX [Hyphomicrobiaceae bacterium]|nr:sulfur oxidation c-type cytochrome SoxX [Hyphomicrobiaceae bacterium]
MKRRIVCAVALLALTGGAWAQQAAKVDPAVVDKTIKETFKSAPAEWQARIEPDEAQRICSETRGNPPPDVAQKLIDSANASIIYPSDGNVIGDWKKGQQLAQRGTGGQFSDRPDTPKGANCYACHQLSRAELSFGTLGPSLTEYGKIRRFRPAEAKAAYAKIYNAQAVLPCSNMPRFGHNKFLTIEEIKDLTAYLFDPESPVNR